MADNEQVSKTAKTSKFQSLLDSNKPESTVTASIAKDITQEDLSNTGMTKDEVVSGHIYSSANIYLYTQFNRAKSVS